MTSGLLIEPSRLLVNHLGTFGRGGENLGPERQVIGDDMDHLVVVEIGGPDFALGEFLLLAFFLGLFFGGFFLGIFGNVL